MTTEQQFAAGHAAARSGVEIVEILDMAPLHAISALFAQVWGRTPEGVPVHTEVMRSLVHAGGLVSAAHDTTSGELLGAAVLGRDVPGACYGYIAAAAPGAGDRGIGRALKQHQRSWAVEHGMSLMRWTFDPLVSRNARFNLTRLGATVRDYEPAFYGEMADDLNGTDVGDRLVAHWELTSERASLAAAGDLPGPTDDPASAPPAGADLEDGPDGIPALVVTPGERWVRVPADVVELRRTDPGQAAAWRSASAAWFQDALADGLVADGVSRTGWYHLAPLAPATPEGERA